MTTFQIVLECISRCSIIEMNSDIKSSGLIQKNRKPEHPYFVYIKTGYNMIKMPIFVLCLLIKGIRVIKFYKILFIVLVLVLPSACTTVKEIKKVDFVSEIPTRNILLKSLAVKASIEMDSPEGSNSATARVNIAGMDSLQIKISGPFGISVAQMYADPEKFVFYNIFQNEVLEGSSSALNFQKALSIPLSYSDFVRLLRAEIPSENANYTRSATSTRNLFSNNSNPNYSEIVTVSPDGITISRYQREISDGVTIVDVLYNNYINYNGIYLPSQTIFRFPEAETKVVINVRGYDINKKIDKPFSFKIPKSIQRYKLD